MSDKWNEMRNAYREAQNQINAADAIITDMARMLRGRLRTVDSTYVLQSLKKELQDFNAHTGRWRG